jgi:hypothetical protein
MEAVLYKTCAKEIPPLSYLSFFLTPRYFLLNTKTNSVLQVYITFCLDELLDFELISRLLILDIHADPRPCNYKKMYVNLEECNGLTSDEVTQDHV